MYQKVYVRVWSDAKFKELSAPPANAQTLWLRLLTGPERSAFPVFVCAGRMQLAEALRWSVEDFDRCFAEIETQGMAEADWENRLILLPNGLKDNAPNGPNTVIAWRKFYGTVSECHIKQRALVILDAFADGWSDSIKQKVAEQFGKLITDAKRKPRGMASRMASPRSSPIHQHQHQHQQEDPSRQPQQHRAEAKREPGAAAQRPDPFLGELPVGFGDLPIPQQVLAAELRALTGETNGRIGLYRTIVSKLPEQLVRTGLSQLKQEINGGGVENRGATMVQIFKRLAGDCELELFAEGEDG